MVERTDWLKQREDFKKRLEANQSQDEPAKEKTVITRQKLSIPSIFSSPKSKVEDDKRNKRMSSVEPYSKTNFVMAQSLSKSVDCLNRSSSERKISVARLPENAKDMKSDKVTDIIDPKSAVLGNPSEVKAELKNQDIPKSSETVNPNRKLIDTMTLDIKPYQTRNSTPVLLLPSPMSPLTKYFEVISSPTAKSPLIGRKVPHIESPNASKTLRKLSSVVSQKPLNEPSEALNDQTSEDIKSPSNMVRKLSTHSQTFSRNISKEFPDNLNNNNNSDIPSPTKDENNKNNSKIISNSPEVRITEQQKPTYENVSIVKPPRKITEKLSNISLDENKNTVNNDEGVVLRKKIMTFQSTTMCFDFTSKSPNESPTSPLRESISMKKRSAIRLDAPIPQNVQEVVKKGLNNDTINKIDILLKENYDKTKNDIDGKSVGNSVSFSYENVKPKNDPEINIMNNELNNNLSCDPIYENLEIFRNHVPGILNTSPIKKPPIAQVRENFLRNCSIQPRLRK